MRIPRRPKQRRNIGRSIRKERRLCAIMQPLSQAMCRKLQMQECLRLWMDPKVETYTSSSATVDNMIQAVKKVKPSAEMVEELRTDILRIARPEIELVDVDALRPLSLLFAAPINRSFPKLPVCV